MRLLPFSPVSCATMTTTLAAGCAANTTAVGTMTVGIGLGVGLYHLYHFMVKGRGRGQRPPAPPGEASPVPTAVVSPLSGILISELRRRIRFTGPFRAEIDLREYSLPLKIRLTRRDREGIETTGDEILLGLNDPFVSLLHADLLVERRAGRDGWNLYVHDHSRNGTVITGWATVNHEAQKYFLLPDREKVTLQVGRYGIDIRLAETGRRVVVPERFPNAVHGEYPPAAAGPRAALDPVRVRQWIQGQMDADRIVEADVSDVGITVRIRSTDLRVSSVLSLTFPHGATGASIRSVARYVNNHCRLFRLPGLPTVDVALQWHEKVNPYGIIAFEGNQAQVRTVAASNFGEGVTGTLTELDLRNAGGIPKVSMVFPFANETETQAIRMIEQVREAFGRIRRALGHVHAPWEVIDPIAGIFHG